MLPIYQPYLNKDILKYAHDAINSGWISSQGMYKEIVEYKIRDLLGVKYVLLLNSGTAAVHLMARSLSLFYPNIKNIIVPNNVYVAAWNGFLFDGNYKLIPIDADIDTWLTDHSLIDSFDTNDTALLAVHSVNGIVNVPNLQKKYGNGLILEDACEGFLGKYNNEYVGTKSLCSSISFFGNKTITSGEGGALLTNDKYIYEYSKRLHGQGQSNERYKHYTLGYNYRMTNIQAAILYGQIEQLPIIISKKKRIFDYYTEMLSQIPNVIIQKTEENTIQSNWMMGVRILNNKLGYKHIEDYFKSKGVDLRPMFYPMSEHSYLKYVSNNKNESVATILSNECFIVPCYPDMTEENTELVYNTLKSYVEKYIDTF